MEHHLLRSFLVSLVTFGVLCADRVSAATGQPPQGPRRRRERRARERTLRCARKRSSGPAAGAFAGQRTFSATTNAKGEWNILGITPGIWLFEVVAPELRFQSVALPVRLLTASGPNAERSTPDVGPGAQADGRTAREFLAAGDRRGGIGAHRQERGREDAARPRPRGSQCRLSRRVRTRRAARARHRDGAHLLHPRARARSVVMPRRARRRHRRAAAARFRSRVARVRCGTQPHARQDEQKFLSYAIADLATIKIR